MIRRLDLRLLRFAAVGTGVAGFYILCFLALEAAGLHRITANAAAFLAAVALQYLGQTVFTFRRKLAVPDQIARFAAMIGLGLLVSAGITAWIGPALGWAGWVSALAVTLILPVQNYLILKLWVYSGKTACPEGL